MALPNLLNSDMAYKIHLVNPTRKEQWQKECCQKLQRKLGKPRKSSGHFCENYVYVATHEDVYSLFYPISRSSSTRNFGEIVKRIELCSFMKNALQSQQEQEKQSTESTRNSANSVAMNSNMSLTMSISGLNLPYMAVASPAISQLWSTMEKWQLCVTLHLLYSVLIVYIIYHLDLELKM